jgi:glycosyltransferase involved in cell wall biosynthesis
MPKILVFIPAYRCEQQIGRVLNQFDAELQKLVHTVMVVDNRSPDNTLAQAVKVGKSVFRACRFVVWKNDQNYGLGGSHKAAFRYAIENGFEHLIVLHGDDQADIRDLVPYLKGGEHLKYDCFMGARFMPGSKLKGYSWFRTFGNHVYNKLFSLVVLRNISDLGSGLNMYRLDKFREFYYKSYPDDLVFNYVMLLASYHFKQSVKFFPISWREEDQISNVKLFQQARRVLVLLVKFMFLRRRFLDSEMRTKTFDTYSGSIEYSSD